MYTFLNGQILPVNEARLALNDIGILRGYGVCDVARTQNHQPFVLDRHLTRLRRSAEQMHITLPYSDEQLRDAVLELVDRNTQKEASIKFIVTGGPSSDGITYNPETPTVYILVDEFKPLPVEYFQNGITLLTHAHQRYQPEIKTLNYLTMVHNHPLRQAAGAFELLYHHNGELREAATSNIFLVHGNTISTPSLDVLPGITRSVVLELARQQYEVQERAVGLNELWTANEVFLTATNKDVLPVVAVDGQTVGRGEPGRQTQELLEVFREFRSAA